MAFTTLCSFLLLVTYSFSTLSSAATVTLCSNQNTGSSFNGVANNYQSNGACSTTCSGYSYGIVQYNMCWCSNIAPGETTSLGSCNQDCPGYPMDKCGNQDSGLFGYIDLGKAPQGTADAGGPSPSPSSAAAQSPSQTPQEQTVTSLATVVHVSSAVSVESIYVTPTTAPAQVSTSASPTVQSTTWSPTPSTSFVTLGGTVRTVVVTPSAPAQATTTVVASGSPSDNAQADNQTGGGGFFSNTGAVAGVFTVVSLIAAGIIGAAIWFMFWRRKQDHEGSERLNSFEEERGSRPPTFLSRRTSELGLKTDLGGVATRGSDEKTPTSTHMTPGTMSRRTSIPLTDSRLNAAAMFHDNGSHMSVHSLQDDRDYTRPVLQVANPDRPGSSAIEDD